MSRAAERPVSEDERFAEELRSQQRARDSDDHGLSPLRSTAALAEQADLLRNFDVVVRSQRLHRLTANALEEWDLLELARLLTDKLEAPAAADVSSSLGSMVSTGSLDALRINYDVYSRLREDFEDRPVMHRTLTTTTFLKFPRDADDCISARALLRYFRGRVQLCILRRQLVEYDLVGDGFIREHGLEDFVYASIVKMPNLAQLQENFYPFYVFTAVRKFFFFLDTRRTGRISISELVSSRVAAEWLQLAQPLTLPPSDPAADHLRRAAARGTAGSPGDDAPASGSPVSELLLAQDGAARAYLASLDNSSGNPSSSNWFSAENALRVYGQYLELDTDQNGMLSPSELLLLRGGTLTESFVHRVFQECHTYGGEMDYKAFLDFMLALEYRVSHQSLRYMFRVLDLHRTGRLGRFELRYFLRDVAARMQAAGHEAVDVNNVCDEIFDMVAPGGNEFLTLEDLKRCRVGHTVLHILTDVAGFWTYDNRESLMQQGGPGNGGGGQLDGDGHSSDP